MTTLAYWCFVITFFPPPHAKLNTKVVYRRRPQTVKAAEVYQKHSITLSFKTAAHANKDNVPCRPVAGQRPRNKQIYKSRC
jgi:hypothetical protein